MTLTDLKYLNDAKCENMIGWLPKFKLILFANSENQAFASQKYSETVRRGLVINIIK